MFLIDSSSRSAVKIFVVLALILGLPTFADAQVETSLQAPTNLRVAKSPYQHVVPTDVGVTIGVGVTSPIPTDVWSSSTTINVYGTVIENVVVNGCLDIYADNVTVRNVIINCAGLYPIDIRARNLVVENSKIDCTSATKAILMFGPGSARVVRNEIQGCEDFLFINGDVNGLVVEDNFMHSLVGPPEAHADGFHMGESQDTYGEMIIRGNYIWKNNDEIGATDIVFATKYSRHTIIIENNFFHPWGHYTLRCEHAATCIARNNVYSLEFLNPEIWEGLSNLGVDEFTCNRYEDGVLLDENIGDMSACPAFVN